MIDTLVIVESPGKIKTISKFLGRKYKVVASVGHVRDLPKSKMGVDIENDFEPKYIPIRGKGDLIKELKKHAKDAKRVLLATDPDREGEAISWHLSHLLDIKQTDKCRITFNEITKSAINEAVKNPREINMELVDAQQARRVLDRIVGYQISPLLWKKVKKGLSAGRVQSVTLKLICDREKEINDFEQKEYWTIDANLLKAGTKKPFVARFYGTSKKMELNSEEEVDKILEAIKDKDFVVKSIVKKEKKRNPAAPFITSTLQQEASRKLNMTSRITMSHAQKLYEGVEIKGRGTLGLITYMRTDSTRISNEAREGAKQFIIDNYGAQYVPASPRIYKNKNSSQDGHEAIRPTYFDMTPDKVKDFLPRDQYRVYKLIWDRFIASQMATAVFDTVTADIATGDYIFRANGSTVKFDGFMKLYSEGKDEKDEEDDAKALPVLEEGEVLEPKSLAKEQHFTQPPARYTEASLVKVMEELGIGRPSTYAATMSTISARGYVTKEKKILYPTELGQIVNNLMENYFKKIVDVGFTASMESELDSVEEGKVEWKNVLREFYKDFAVELKNAEEEIAKIQVPPEESDQVCELCGRTMVYKQGKFGKFLACPGFPECRNTKPIIRELNVACVKCGGKILIRKDKRGRDYYYCEKGKECGEIYFDMPTGEKCPKCGSMLVRKRRGKGSYVACSNSKCGKTE